MIHGLPRLLALVAAVVALLPFVLLAGYAFPSADDYCLAVLSKGRFWGMQIEHYLYWTGRYAASFLQAIATQGDMARLYAWPAYATLAATFLSFWTLLAVLPARPTRQFPLLVAAAVATAVFIGGLPSLVEAFYWMASAVTYQWGLIVYVFWLAVLVRLLRPVETAAGRLGLRAVAVLLTVVLPGFNEVTMPIVLATFGSFLFIGWQKNRRIDWFVLALLGIALACMAAALLAPGNAARSLTYPVNGTRHNLEFALLETARQTARFIRARAVYAAPWIAAFAAWWWGRDIVAAVVRAAGGLRQAWVIAAGLVALVYATLFPLYWEYGDTNFTGEGRTYNVTYFVLSVAIVWSVGVLLSGLPRQWETRLDRWRGRPEANLVLAGALAAAMIAAPVIAPAYRALEVAPGHLAAEQMREAAMEAAAARGEEALVPVLSATPFGLYWGDIDPEPGHWINSCVAQYYGLPSVRSYRRTE